MSEGRMILGLFSLMFIAFIVMVSTTLYQSVIDRDNLDKVIKDCVKTELYSVYSNEVLQPVYDCSVRG